MQMGFSTPTWIVTTPFLQGFGEGDEGCITMTPNTVAKHDYGTLTEPQLDTILENFIDKEMRKEKSKSNQEDLLAAMLASHSKVQKGRKNQDFNFEPICDYYGHIHSPQV